REIRAAGTLIHGEHVLPRGAAVRRVKHAPFLLRAEGLADGAHVHAVRVAWIDHDARDVSRRIQAHVLPRASRVGRLVDAVAERVIGTNQPGLTRAGPDRVVRGGRDGERADGGDVLVVEDGPPGDARVGGFPDAAVRGADVHGHRVARHAPDRRDAIAFGTAGPGMGRAEPVRRAVRRRPGRAAATALRVGARAD